MRISLLIVFFMLTLAACSPAATALPVPTPTPLTLQSPASYSTGMLVTRWEPTVQRHILQPVDPATGKDIPGYVSIDLGVNYYTVFSPDQTLLAVVSYPTEPPTQAKLAIIDLRTWKARELSFQVGGWINTLVFSPDGSKLAMASSYSDGRMLLFSVADLRLVAQMKVGYEITKLHFTHSGSDLMAYGRQITEAFTVREHTDGFARISLLDTGDLSVRWSAEVAGVRDGIYPTKNVAGTDLHQPGNSEYVLPGLAFAPDADMLYIVHTDQGRMTKIDYERREITSLRLQPALSWLEHLLMLGAHSAHAKAANGSSLEAVVSPDGEMIYVTGLKQEFRTVSSGDWEMETTPLNLRGIRTSDGTLEFEQEVFASGLSTSADGKRLFLQGSVDGSVDGEPATLIFDTTKRGMIGQYEQVYAWPGRLMNGTDVLVAARAMEDGHSTRMLVFDARSQRKLAEWISTSYAEWIVNR